MKTGILSSLFLIIFQLSYAQVTDTLGYQEFLTGTETLYASPNGGYAFGNNGYEDKAKAQSYAHTSSFVLKEVLMLFGDVIFDSADSSSHIRVNLYDNNGVGITSNGILDSIAPDGVISWVDIPVYQLLDDGSLTVADFSDSTIVITTGFSVGIDLTYLSAGDTVGLASTEDGDAVGTFNAWEKTANNNWFTVEESAYSWGLSVDLAIFPVIDENDPAGLAEQTVSDFNLYPNPCVDEVRISNVGMSEYDVEIYDVQGRLLVQIHSNRSNKSIDVSDLEPGIYHLVVSKEAYQGANQFIKL